MRIICSCDLSGHLSSRYRPNLTPGLRSCRSEERAQYGGGHMHPFGKGVTRGVTRAKFAQYFSCSLSTGICACAPIFGYILDSA